MSEEADEDELGTQMADAMSQHADYAKFEYLRNAALEISRIYSASDDPEIKRLCRELRGKMLELSNRIVANILRESGF